MSDIAVHHSLPEYKQQQPAPTMTAQGGSVFTVRINKTLSKWQFHWN